MSDQGNDLKTQLEAWAEEVEMMGAALDDEPVGTAVVADATEAEETGYITCKHCNGLGEVDPAETLDLGNLDAVRKELISVVTADSRFGIHAADRSDRLHYLGRAVFLAGRAIWLEAAAQTSADNAERLALPAEDKALVKDVLWSRPWGEARKILDERKAAAAQK